MSGCFFQRLRRSSSVFSVQNPWASSTPEMILTGNPHPRKSGSARELNSASAHLLNSEKTLRERKPAAFRIFRNHPGDQTRAFFTEMRVVRRTVLPVGIDSRRDMHEILA